MKRIFSTLLLFQLFTVGWGNAIVAEGNVTQTQTFNKENISVESRVKPTLVIDGLKFRDLNDNGTLDPYEDWRLSVEERTENLVSLMTVEEKIGLMMHMNNGGNFDANIVLPWTDETLERNKYRIEKFHVTHILDNNIGTLEYLADFHNRLQEYAEATRLGIPITFSCDRGYDVWGGMIDMPHTAFSTAIGNNPNLVKQILEVMGKEMSATGFNMILQPAGAEVFNNFGENSDRTSSVVGILAAAYTNNNVQVCLKHFIGNSYAQSQSAAGPAILDNWLKTYQAGFDNGADYVMITDAIGVSGLVKSHYDSPTIDGLLRKKMNFDGVILTDWFALEGGEGTTVEGIDLSTLSLKEKYKFMIEIGIDQFGRVGIASGIGEEGEEDDSGLAMPGNIAGSRGAGGGPGGGFPPQGGIPPQGGMPEGTGGVGGGDAASGFFSRGGFSGDAPARTAVGPVNYPNVIINMVKAGEISEGRIDESARRILHSKFEMGLFEDPYVSQETTLEVVASVKYAARQFKIDNNADLEAARNPRTVSLDKQLMAASTVLLKNDDILPLKDGVSVYIVSESDAFAKSLEKYCKVLKKMDKADFVLVNASGGDPRNQRTVTIPEVKKPVIIIGETSTSMVEDERIVALLYTTYNAGVDHGNSIGNFERGVTADVIADMLFGRMEPSGTDGRPGHSCVLPVENHSAP